MNSSLNRGRKAKLGAFSPGQKHHMTISRAHVSTHRGDVIYLEAAR